MKTISDLLDWYDSRHAKAIYRILGDKPISGLTRKDILQAIRQRNTEVSEATTAREFAVLRSALRRATLDEIIQNNPFQGVKLAKSHKRVRYILPSEEPRFQDALAKSPIWLQEMVVVARQTGIRQGNLIRLTWDQVDLKRREIVIEKTKNGHPIMQPMTQDVHKALSGALTRRNLAVPYVWHVRGHIPKSSVYAAFKALCVEAGMENFRFHDLRHDFCSKLVQNGVPIAEVKELAGHLDIQSTLRYAHLAPEQKRNAIKKLEVLD